MGAGWVVRLQKWKGTGEPWRHRMAEAWYPVENRVMEDAADQITGFWHAQNITRGAVTQTGNMRQGGQFGPASGT